MWTGKQYSVPVSRARTKILSQPKGVSQVVSARDKSEKSESALSMYEMSLIKKNSGMK